VGIPSIGPPDPGLEHLAPGPPDRMTGPGPPSLRGAVRHLPGEPIVPALVLPALVLLDPVSDGVLVVPVPAGRRGGPVDQAMHRPVA
jgi:hypothetical protein